MTPVPVEDAQDPAPAGGRSPGREIWVSSKKIGGWGAIKVLGFFYYLGRFQDTQLSLPGYLPWVSSKVGYLPPGGRRGRP
jgi:hypothetical protein